MTSDKFQVNTFGGGMNTDTDLSLLKSHQYIYAENVRIIGDASNSSGVLLNSNNIKLISSTILTAGEIILGITVMQNTCVIFTKSDNTTNPTNRAIRLDFKGTGDIDKTIILFNGSYGLLNNLSIVNNKESDTVEKVYFADGVNLIRVLDITKPVNDKTFKITDLDIVPDSDLIPFEIESTGFGSLKAGKYQYTYQLFTNTGVGTELAPLTSMVSIANSNVTDSVSFGDVSANKTNKSINLRLVRTDNKFELCRIYSIYYPSNTAIPTISVIDEIKLKDTTDNVIITDDGSSSLNTITVQEFNGIVGIKFKPTLLERLDNKLFASNITDDTWDIPDDYDTRAYRCNRNGDVLLQSNTGDDIKFNINDIATTNVPQYHDCINPDLFTVKNLFSDSYSYKEKVIGTQVSTDASFKDATMGGIGKNISYEFRLAKLVGQSAKQSRIKFKGKNYQDEDGYNYSFDDGDAGYDAESKLILADGDGEVRVTPEPITDIWITKVVGEQGYLINEPGYILAGWPSKLSETPIIGKRDFSNPLIADRLRGYLRDEIYRFGIVFRNKKSIKSPVRWIADIKIPCVQQLPLFASYDNVQLNKSFETSLDLFSVGIEFSVNKLPEGAVSYEIVRCQRTLQDRTIFAKGILSTCVKPDITKQVIQPLPYLTTGPHTKLTIVDSSNSNRFYGPYDMNDGMLRANNTYTFISPEVSYNKDGISKLVNKSMSIESTGGLYSLMRDTPNEVLIGAFTGREVYYKKTPKISTHACFGDTSTAVLQAGVPASYFSPTPTSGNHYSNDNAIDGSPGAQAYKPFFGSLIVNTPNHDYDKDTKEPTMMIAKYFKPINHKQVYGPRVRGLETPIYAQTRTISDIKYPKPLMWSNTEDEINANSTPIDNYIYNNWSTMMVQDSSGKFPIPDLLENAAPRIAGPYGYCLVLTLNPTGTDELNCPTLHTGNLGNFKCKMSNRKDKELDMDITGTSILTCNLRQSTSPYGGPGYNSRENSVYISTGIPMTYYDATEKKSKNVQFGGDTYVGLYFHNTTMIFEEKDNLSKWCNKRYIGAYIPMESTVNFQFKQDTAVCDVSNYIGIKYIQNNAGQMSNHYTQSTPPYAYDDAYSAQSVVEKSVSRTKNDKINRKIGNRILNSLSKTNGETVDNWCRFMPLDYIDVDNRYGELTNLKVFNNKLFYWQINAFGIASVNERSLIKDNNISSLTLGTAGVLSRCDYVSTSYGNSVTNDKSIINTDTTMYWYDYDKSEILGYGGSQLHNLSKVKNVQGYVNDNKPTTKGNAVSFHDNAHNEIGFRFNDKGTLIYNEALGVFTSVNTIAIPNATIKLPNNLVTICNNDFVLHAKGLDKDKYANSTSKIEIVVNNDYEYTKVFDNGFLNGDLFLNDSSVGETTFMTKSQKGVLPATHIANREGTYAYAIPRQIAVTNEYPERLRGKYLKCAYQFNNVGYSGFRIPQIRTTYRYSLV